MALESNNIRRSAGIENVCLGASVNLLKSSACVSRCVTTMLVAIDEQPFCVVVTTQDHARRSYGTIQAAPVPTYSP